MAPSEQCDVYNAHSITLDITAKTRRVEHFKFNLCDRVLVKEIQRPGVVDTLLVDGLGVQYWVSYWNDSKRERVLMFEWELELRNAQV